MSLKVRSVRPTIFLLPIILHKILMASIKELYLPTSCSGTNYNAEKSFLCALLHLKALINGMNYCMQWSMANGSQRLFYLNKPWMEVAWFMITKGDLWRNSTHCSSRKIPGKKEIREKFLMFANVAVVLNEKLFCFLSSSVVQRSRDVQPRL